MNTLAATTALLQRVALDRQTKLQILEILAARPDPRVIEDVATLLRSYEDLDAGERGSLTKRLAGIDAAFQERLKASAHGLGRDIRAAQDDIQRNDEIERIRKSLA